MEVRARAPGIGLRRAKARASEDREKIVLVRVSGISLPGLGYGGRRVRFPGRISLVEIEAQSGAGAFDSSHKARRR